MFDLNTVPSEPGCYLFKDTKGKILYVGKAKNLKKRVSDYANLHNLDIKTTSMLTHVRSVDVMVTDTEVEALILENTLIKKYQPRYNIRLKGAKSHSYILLTDEPYPRVLIARQKVGKGRFYGPFVSAQERDYVLQFIKKTFSLRTCKKFPKKPCLRYHIHLCDAPCIHRITQEDYCKKIERVKLILGGNITECIQQMQNEMQDLSEKFEFEQALNIRNEITALQTLNERQNVQRQKAFNEDILSYQIKDNNVYLLLFNIDKGTLHNKNEFIFEYSPEFFEEFMLQYYSENPVPKELILPKTPPAPLSRFLEEKRGNRIKITVPKRGEKKQLLDLVDKNIDITFFSNINKMETLKNRLNLQESPTVIECFDISHLSGTSTVGSMVQFRNGKPDKSNYRRFRIRTVAGIDDVASIGEIVRRRYIRLKNEGIEFPDLIIIDGGRGQLNYALHELERIGLKIPVISLAKHYEEVYIPGTLNPLQLSQKDKALQFIREIRDEAHRFAISYNRLLRKKEMIT